MSSSNPQSNRFAIGAYVFACLIVAGAHPRPAAMSGLPMHGPVAR
jgi:hypothetical protein